VDFLEKEVSREVALGEKFLYCSLIDIYMISNIMYFFITASFRRANYTIKIAPPFTFAGNIDIISNTKYGIFNKSSN